MSASAVMWSLLAVLVFWAIGAYNRLVRLRGRSLLAFAVVDKQFNLQALLLAPTAVGPHPGLSASALLPGDEGRENRWSGLVGAGRQLEASLKAARVRPLDGASLDALRTAHETLVLSWSRCREEPPDLAGSPLPEDLSMKWDQLLVQTDMARAEFNAVVADYNAAIGQVPACLLASLFGFKPTQPL
ncbi:LemA family protein [Rhodoferax sp.]|uniref:LemA family protein n=1 Tax=Rhodoferax sp. TaxID=50421 RepID=UPI00275EEFA3|nr:LemA family protein [Rhodoferax sp.]